MSRPELVVENADAVYDYYANREPNSKTAHTLHYIFGKVYRPEVHFEEGAAEAIETHLEEKGNLIWASTHELFHDQFIMAALAERYRELQKLRANTVILGKVPLFKAPIPGLRPILDSFGAIPTFRSKDIAKEGGDPTTTRDRATKLLVATAIKHIDVGRNLAIYPEGTRGSNPEKVQKIRSGIGHIACGTANPDNILIMPSATNYHNGDRKFTPTVYIGQPFEVAASPSEVVDDVKEKLQHCVDEVNALASSS